VDTDRYGWYRQRQRIQLPTLVEHTGHHGDSGGQGFVHRQQELPEPSSAFRALPLKTSPLGLVAGGITFASEQDLLGDVGLHAHPERQRAFGVEEGEMTRGL